MNKLGTAIVNALLAAVVAGVGTSALAEQKGAVIKNPQETNAAKNDRCYMAPTSDWMVETLRLRQLMTAVCRFAKEITPTNPGCYSCIKTGGGDGSQGSAGK